MTASSSNTRLILYVALTMVTAAAAGLATVDFADFKQIAAFILSVIGSGLTTARAYIDKSTSEVLPKSDQP